MTFVDLDNETIGIRCDRCGVIKDCCNVCHKCSDCIAKEDLRAKRYIKKNKHGHYKGCSL
jgi:hypothetical protein